ncbi:MAG: hypothetical protein R3B68_03735 [Phycisphaerales bacterium]
MSILGTNVAQSVAASEQAQRVQSKDVEKAKRETRATRRREDEVEISGGVEAPEAVRNLKDATHEESQEDRNAKPGYTPTRDPDHPDAPPRLDVEG